MKNEKQNSDPGKRGYESQSAIVSPHFINSEMRDWLDFIEAWPKESTTKPPLFDQWLTMRKAGLLKQP